MVSLPQPSFLFVNYCLPVQVAQVAFACAKAGYVPSATDELLQVARSAYRKLVAQRKYKWALKLLYSLTNLQLFLDSELSKLFTLETLEDLDLYMAGINTCCCI